MKRTWPLQLYATLLMAALAVLAAVPLVIGAEQQQDILKVLAEKAREREAAFDGFDMRFTYVLIDGPPEDPAFVTNQRFVSSRGRYYSEARTLTRHVYDPGHDSTWVHACDGQIARWVSRSPISCMGNVKRAGDAERPCIFERWGLTRLEESTAALSDLLRADNEQLREKYGQEFSGFEITASASGREAIDGHDCYVVDLAYARNGEVREASWTAKLWFAPDLNYSCVRVDSSPHQGWMSVRNLSFRLSDFREVRKGLFIPFAGSRELVYREGSVPFSTYKIESIEFPAGFDDSLFTLQFPPGTKVADEITGVRYTTGGGAEVKVPMEEAAEETGEKTGASVEAVASSGESVVAEPPVQPEPVSRVEKSTSHRWLFVAVLALGAIVVIAIVLWRHRGSRP